MEAKMINAALLDGFEIILVVTVMSVVLCPILCWILPDRFHQSEGGKALEA